MYLLRGRQVWLPSIFELINLLLPMSKDLSKLVTAVLCSEYKHTLLGLVSFYASLSSASGRELGATRWFFTLCQPSRGSIWPKTRRIRCPQKLPQIHSTKSWNTGLWRRDPANLSLPYPPNDKVLPRQVNHAWDFLRFTQNLLLLLPEATRSYLLSGSPPCLASQ